MLKRIGFITSVLFCAQAFGGDYLAGDGNYGLVEPGAGSGGGSGSPPSGTATGDVDMSTFKLRYGAGTEALPGLTPTGDPDTGISASAGDNFDISTAATYRLRLNATRLLLASPIQGPAGTTTNPTYGGTGNSSNTGFYFGADDQVNLSLNGTSRWEWASNGKLTGMVSAAGPVLSLIPTSGSVSLELPNAGRIITQQARLGLSLSTLAQITVLNPSETVFSSFRADGTIINDTGTLITVSDSLSVTGSTLTITTGDLIITDFDSPLSGDACTAGTISIDADYIYVCTASGVWKRSALTGGY